MEITIFKFQDFSMFSVRTLTSIKSQTTESWSTSLYFCPNYSRWHCGEVFRSAVRSKTSAAVGIGFFLKQRLENIGDVRDHERSMQVFSSTLAHLHNFKCNKNSGTHRTSSTTADEQEGQEGQQCKNNPDILNAKWMLKYNYVTVDLCTFEMLEIMKDNISHKKRTSLKIKKRRETVREPASRWR